MFCAQCGSPHEQSVCPVCGTISTRPRGATATPEHDLHTGHVLAGWWRRVGSTVVDSLIVSVPLEAVRRTSWGTAVLALYLMVCWLNNGATIGNLVTGTKIVTTSGLPLATPRVMRRWGAYYLFNLPSTLTGTMVLRSVHVIQRGQTMQLVIDPHLSNMVVAGFVGSLVLVAVDSLWPLVQSRRQTLHDVLAATIVVKR
jgi:uncharacterized RDD family membrane protein YckC